MNSPFDKEDEGLQERFPLSDEKHEHVSKIVALVRGNLARLSARGLRSASDSRGAHRHS
jgi:hypothetical protein